MSQTKGEAEEMYSFGSGSVRNLGLGLGMLMLLGLVALFTLVPGNARAAQTHTIEVDNGRLTMGYVFLNNQILPADVPGPLDPDLSNTSSTGTIDVKVDGSTATVSEEDFNMPIVWIPDPTAGGAPIPMDFGPSGDLAGTWDAATGELSLTGTLQVDVIWGYNEDGAQICRFTAPDVTWTTAPNAISPGTPFDTASGLDGDGAISAYWDDLPDGESINGGACGKPNAVVHDPGAVWLSSGIENPAAPPTCQEQGMDGLWPDCEEIEWPEPDPVVEITKVKVGKASVKAGKKVRVAIKVTNEGDLAASGLALTLKSSNKKVRIAKKVKLNVPADSTKTIKVLVKTNKKAKGKATITAKAAGVTGKGVVTVKKAKKKKKK